MAMANRHDHGYGNVHGHDQTQVCTAIYGHIWPYIWPYMAIYGHIWRYMAHVWPYMAVCRKAYQFPEGCEKFELDPLRRLFGNIWSCRLHLLSILVNFGSFISMPSSTRQDRPTDLTRHQLEALPSHSSNSDIQVEQSGEQQGQGRKRQIWLFCQAIVSIWLLWAPGPAGQLAQGRAARAQPKNVRFGTFAWQLFQFGLSLIHISEPTRPY